MEASEAAEVFLDGEPKLRFRLPLVKFELGFESWSKLDVFLIAVKTSLSDRILVFLGK